MSQTGGRISEIVAGLRSSIASSIAIGKLDSEEAEKIQMMIQMQFGVCESMEPRITRHSDLNSQAGPASACVKVLRSIIKDNSQHCTDKSAGVLIIQAEAPVNLPGIPPKLKAIEMAAAYISLSFGTGYFGSSMDRPKVSILRSARQQSRTDMDQFATRIDLSAEKML